MIKPLGRGAPNEANRPPRRRKAGWGVVPCPTENIRVRAQRARSNGRFGPNRDNSSEVRDSNREVRDSNREV